MEIIPPCEPIDPGEWWKPVPVPRFETLYLASNRGRTWSVPRITGQNKQAGGYLLTPVLRGPRGHERLEVTLCSGSRETNWSVKVHQLVMLTFVGPCPEGQEVLHLDGDRFRNWWPENLAYDTHIVNQRQMVEHGTAALALKVGSQRLNSKLTEELVPVIRAEYDAGKASGLTERDLSDKYGVNVSTLHRMLTRQTWKHVA